nr:cAMP-binding protein [uncultured bacterium]
MSDEKYRKYAQKIPIFKGFEPEDVDYILHHGKIMDFHTGQTIFHEGMLGSNVFIILSGEVGIFRRNELIASCKIGDAFGEMAVLNKQPRTATATATTDTRCFTIDEKELNEVLKKHVATKLLLNVIHVLSERLEGANAWIAEAKKTGHRP